MRKNSSLISIAYGFSGIIPATIASVGTTKSVPETNIKSDAERLKTDQQGRHNRIAAVIATSVGDYSPINARKPTPEKKSAKYPLKLLLDYLILVSIVTRSQSTRMDVVAEGKGGEGNGSGVVSGDSSSSVPRHPPIRGTHLGEPDLHHNRTGNHLGSVRLWDTDFDSGSETKGKNFWCGMFR